jgi:hypothetical protein
MKRANEARAFSDHGMMKVDGRLTDQAACF